MKEVPTIFEEILNIISAEEERQKNLAELQLFLRPQGAELFKTSADILRRSGLPKTILYSADGNPKRIQRLQILESHPVSTVVRINGKSQEINVNLLIHPSRMFERELKPGISIHLATKGFNPNLKITSKPFFTISKEGQVLNWKNEYVSKDEMAELQRLILFLKEKSRIVNLIPLTNPLLS